MPDGKPFVFAGGFWSFYLPSFFAVNRTIYAEAGLYYISTVKFDIRLDREQDLGTFLGEMGFTAIRRLKFACCGGNGTRR